MNIELTKDEVWALKVAILQREELLKKNQNKKLPVHIEFMKDKNNEELKILRNLFDKLKKEKINNGKNE